ncbi:kinetochore Spc24 family protein [Sporobolomyces koalae]|uniref:kinetochore Spc24 family protein n=1 Tax=Sporobolomyces koalae TaxID=500713 RepID=UPI0031747BAE
MANTFEPLPPRDDFENTFGELLENMLTLFVVEDAGTIKDEALAAAAGESAHNDVESVALCEKRIKDWRIGTKELVDHAREDLRAIALDYKSALASSQRSSNVPSATDHQRQMEAMFQSTVTAMKHNSELDQQVMELQGELARLIQELKQEETDAIELGGLNSEVLRLKMYRDLGFTPLTSTGEDGGKFTKFLVRSAHSREARTVELDPSVNDFTWCNFLWSIVDNRAPPGGGN